jgi:hypothetical protein
VIISDYFLAELPAKWGFEKPGPQIGSLDLKKLRDTAIWNWRRVEGGSMADSYF